MLPSPLIAHLGNKMDIQVAHCQSLGGGSINHAARIDTNKGAFCLKWNSHPRTGMFSSEAEGIALISATHTLRVPEIIAFNDLDPDVFPGFILMEWIEPPTQKSFSMAALGEGLAQMHRCQPVSPRRYGFDHDNYIGSTPQINAWRTSWTEFYVLNRLGYQRDLALRNGRLPPTRRRLLEKLIDQTHRFFSPDTSFHPSLLHGDLWAGNIIPDSTCKPVVIDPAVYYGDREAEIAFTELFGGFQAPFYQAYQANFPLDSGYEERRDLYNLYHLLNHLNLFGEPYGLEVDSMLQHYVG